MGDIFISYSYKDQEFALKLADDIGRYYSVWIDREQVKGGVKWEQNIDSALHDCQIFIVIVSPDSNDSEWVARETIRAEKLEKYRIPVLFRGEMPLRLLNVQYIDFQGEYEGGLRDLLEALEAQLDPIDFRLEDATRLIGEGILSYLQNDHSNANSLIGQALILNPAIADSVESFWESVKNKDKTNWAKQFGPEIEIREWAEVVEKDVYSEQAGRNIDYYQWSVEIATEKAVLEKIDYVRYKLHPTFPKPLQSVRNRKDNFRLGGMAWGTFNIVVDVFFTDGTSLTGDHMLQFATQEVPLAIRK